MCERKRSKALDSKVFREKQRADRIRRRTMTAGALEKSTLEILRNNGDD